MPTPEIRRNLEPLNEVTEQRLQNLLCLTAVCAGGLLMQKTGMTQQFPVGIKETTESLCHPALGYAGAWAGLKIAEKLNIAKNQVIALGASAINFATEGAQAFWAGSPETHFFLKDNIPETAKDYCFAILGAGILYLETYRRERDK